MSSSWFFALAASCWTSSWASCDTPEGGLIKRIWKEEPQARSGAWPLVVWFGFRLENLHERLTGTKSCGLRQRPLGASGRCWQNALKASKCNNIKDDFVHLLHVFMFAKVWFIGASAAKGVCEIRACMKLLNLLWGVFHFISRSMSCDLAGQVQRM